MSGLAMEVSGLLGGQRFNVRHERDLHDAIAVLLDAAAIPHEREVQLSSADRVDFLVDGTLALEVKVAGSPADVLRQLQRYAHHDQVAELLLVTTRAAHARIPAMVGGKPCATHWIAGGVR